MAQTEYKPNICQNCGGYGHCGEVLWRDEEDYDGRQYQIKVCQHCRCKECTNVKSMDSTQK